MFQTQRQASLTKWGHTEINAMGKPTLFSQMSTVTRFIKVVNFALLSLENTPTFNTRENEAKVTGGTGTASKH